MAIPENSVVLVGHTKQSKVNFENLNNDPNKPIIYLDCGNGKLQGFSLTKDEHVQIEDSRNGERS